MFEPFIQQGNTGSKVDWVGLRDEYFIIAEDQSFLPKRNTNWPRIEDNLITALKRLDIVSTSPINNFAIFRSGWWWGLCGSWIGHVFFTDKQTAEEYIKVFAFKHGVADRGEPKLVRCVQA